MNTTKTGDDDTYDNTLCLLRFFWTFW